MEEEKYTIGQIEGFIDLFIEECNIREGFLMEEFRSFILELTPNPQDHVIVKSGLSTYISKDLEDIPQGVIERSDSITTVTYTKKNELKRLMKNIGI